MSTYAHISNQNCISIYINRSLIPRRSSPRTALPTEKEIDENIKAWLNDEILNGNDPNDMELSEVVEVRKCINKLSYVTYHMSLMIMFRLETQIQTY